MEKAIKISWIFGNCKDCLAFMPKGQYAKHYDYCCWNELFNIRFCCIWYLKKDFKFTKNYGTNPKV